MRENEIALPHLQLAEVWENVTYKTLDKLRVKAIMAADDRKKRIMEHLARSSDNMKFVSPKKAINPPPPPISPIPPSQPTPAKVDDRKTRIKEHLSRSSGDFDKLSLSSEQRKKRIQDHIRITMG